MISNHASVTEVSPPRETRGEMPRDNKDETIKLRVSAEEREAWQRAADASEMTLSEWIRVRCNGSPALAPERSRRRS